MTRRRFRYAAVAIAVAALVWVFWPRGPFPRTVYTDTRTELVFDGQTIVVEGTTKCERSSNFNSHGELAFYVIFLDHRGPLYRCGPKWFGTRLPDGSALLVGSYSVQTRWESYFGLPDVELQKERSRLAAIPRAVIWLDDAERPTRGEYYFSTIALDNPASRLTAIRTDILDAVEGSLHGKTASDSTSVVQWLTGSSGPKYMAAYYAISIPKTVWSQVPGLEEIVRDYQNPTFFDPWIVLTRDKAMMLGSIGNAERELLHPMLWSASQFVWEGRSSREFFRRSDRIQALTMQDNRQVRVVSELSKGALDLVPTNGDPSKGAVSTKIDGIVVEEEAEKFWGNSLLFSPSDKSLINYEFTLISPNQLEETP